MMKGPPDPGTPAWSELLMHIVIAARIEPELWSESDALESDGWLARKYLSTLTPAWAEEVYGQEAIDAEFERIVSERAEYVAKLKQLFEIDVSTDQCHLCGLGGRPLADYDFGLAKPTQRKGDWTNNTCFHCNKYRYASDRRSWISVVRNQQRKSSPLDAPCMRRL